MSGWRSMEAEPPPSRGLIDVRSSSVTLFEIEWRDGFWRFKDGYAVPLTQPLKQIFPEWRPAR